MSIYAELSYNDQKVEIQEVKGIQFSILSPERLLSVLLLKLPKLILILVMNQLLEVYLIHVWVY